jgi:hypothetical protein
MTQVITLVMRIGMRHIGSLLLSTRGFEVPFGFGLPWCGRRA